jgi:hypothetical protein
MSAPKAENGFADERIVSSNGGRRNIGGGNVKDFNVRKLDVSGAGHSNPMSPESV